MSALTTTGKWNEEQLLSMPHIGKAELIDGRFIVAPAGSEHGGISMWLGARLAIHVRQKKLGMVFDSSTGFWMNNEDLLSPDVAFVAAARLKGIKRLPRNYFRGAPDLVAEILSPNDRPAEIERKLDDYFGNGTQLVWIVDPRLRTVTVHRPNAAPKMFNIEDEFSGDPELPGFRLKVADIFED